MEPYIVDLNKKYLKSGRCISTPVVLTQSLRAWDGYHPRHRTLRHRTDITGLEWLERERNRINKTWQREGQSYRAIIVLDHTHKKGFLAYEKTYPIPRETFKSHIDNNLE